MFDRHGTEFANYQTDARGNAFYVRDRICGRCGGAGGSDKWKHTGWTCYDCGGSGRRGTEIVKLYTADKLAKLNASKAKRNAKAAAVREEKAAAARQEAENRKADFEAVYGELLARAENLAGRDWFIDEIAGKARYYNSLTENQAAALATAITKLEERDAQKAASQHIGDIGERMELEVTVCMARRYQTDFGTMWIIKMRDTAGNIVVSKGKFCAQENEQFKMRATIKAHDEYNGEKQTVVQRVAAL